jgi:hypothetical protein
MKTSKIEVGKTYQNRGKGRTLRKVLAIGDKHRPKEFLSPFRPPDEPGVLYEAVNGRDAGKKFNLYISSFRHWCGKEVK